MAFTLDEIDVRIIDPLFLINKRMEDFDQDIADV
jgi:hypothetical protein